MLGNITNVLKFKTKEFRKHWIVVALLAGAFFLFFMHTDVIETANHSYILLENIFSGRFLHFYDDVMLHSSSLYYINNAHYNVFVYLIFAVFELPYFVFNSIFGTAPSEVLLQYIGKFVSVFFWAASIFVFKKVAKEYGLEEKDSELACLFLALSAPAVFSVMAMGQYDSICLFFLLISLYFWLKGRYMHFAFWVGIGAACKFFPLFLVVPLVLLVEKRPLHVLKYGAISTWLILPTALLFSGRTGDMSVFTDIMLGRLFDVKIGAAMDVSVLALLYALLCIAAWMHAPKDEVQRKKIGIWIGLAAFGLVFLFSFWHPQWIVLLLPFVVLSTFAEKHRVPWFWVDILLGAGFFIYCAINFEGQLEANMLRLGILELFALPHNNANVIAFYYNLFPLINALPMVLFGAALAAHIVLKLPLKNGTPASKLTQNNVLVHEKMQPYYAWFVFVLPLAVWLVPTIFTFVKSLI